MSNTTNGNGVRQTVTREEFAKNPGAYLLQAEKTGPITITDSAGKPRSMIVVPSSARTIYDDE